MQRHKSRQAIWFQYVITAATAATADYVPQKLQDVLHRLNIR